jgi:Ca-activated chloride channel family protein
LNFDFLIFYMVRFAHIEYLYSLIFVLPLLIVFFIWSFKQKEKALQKFGNIQLVSKLIFSTSKRKQKIKATFVVIGTSFLLFSASGPQIGTKLEDVKREGIDIAIAVDVSNSMLAEDIKPTRLEKAKHEISNLIDKMQGDRVGIIAFAGLAYVQCPLTLDYGAAKLFTDMLNVDLIPQQGTAIGRAMELAMKTFVQKERKYKVLILITDGEETGDTDPLKIAEECEKEGIIIYTVGIGSPEGVPIPIYDGYGNQVGFKKDRDGNVVTTKLDELTLEKIALQTSGKYYRATSSEIELDKIYEEVSKMEKKELSSKQFSQFEERFQYFLFPAIIFLLIEIFISERRKS